MEYVYDLVDSDGQTVYVGASKDPQRRLNEHTKRHDGQFKGREDLSLNIISRHRLRKNALQAEGKRKLSLGFEWTEKIANPTYDKQSDVMTKTNSKKLPCPRCGREMNAGNLSKHLKATDPRSRCT